MHSQHGSPLNFVRWTGAWRHEVVGRLSLLQGRGVVL